MRERLLVPPIGSAHRVLLVLPTQCGSQKPLSWSAKLPTSNSVYAAEHNVVACCVHYLACAQYVHGKGSPSHWQTSRRVLNMQKTSKTIRSLERSLPSKIRESKTLQIWREACSRVHKRFMKLENREHTLTHGVSIATLVCMLAGS